MSKGWIGVDLDGTLAEYDGWKGVEHIGAPVPRMLARVKAWLAQGAEVRIFTARICREDIDVPSDAEFLEAQAAREAIEKWCFEYVGSVLPITNRKDFAMRELWDDRCVQVVENTGVRADGKI